MNGLKDGMKDNMRKLGIGRIEQVGTRDCEDCGNKVPIMERTDAKGEKHQESVCLMCETNRTKRRFPKVEDLKREKARGFSVKYEKVPKKLVGKTVSEYKVETESEKAMRETVADFIINFGNTEHHSLLMAGAMGLGKSHLAYAAGAALRKKGYSTMFIATDDFLQLVKSTYQKETDLSERTIFEMIEEIDLLILDEVGAEYSNRKDDFESWASEKILKVADLRENLPTIYTTNYNPADFEEKYGQVQGGRIVSRMFSGAKRIMVEGKDRRKQF